jgi:hypothetical protein
MIKWLRDLLTPNCFPAAILASTCTFWLSERFRWFGFNEHKGWTVLLALASVCAGILIMLVWFIGAPALRSRFQLSLRSLLLMTLAVALPCSWFALEAKSTLRQAKVAEHINALGGNVRYDYDWDAATRMLPLQRPEPAWRIDLFGEDFYSRELILHVCAAATPNPHLRIIFLWRESNASLTSS